MKRSTQMRHRQKGVSTLGWLGVAGIFGLLLITFFRVFPMYYENFKLKSAMEAVQQDDSIDVKSKRAIWDSLSKRMFVNEVSSVKRENVTMERRDGRTTITVDYEIKDEYIGNLFIGGHFVETIVIER